MKQKSVLAVLLATGMALSGFAGCGESKDTSDTATEDTTDDDAADDTADGALPYEGVTISFMIDSDGSLDGPQAMFDLAKEKLGLTVELETRPGGADGITLMKTRLQAGEMADIAIYNSGSMFYALDPEQNFIPITDQAFVEKFDEGFANAVTVDGEVYGAPWGLSSAAGFVYWKPDYEELGLSIPKTWDEFLANCDALEAAGKTSMLGGFNDGWTSQMLLLGDHYNVVSEYPTFAEEYEAGTAKYSTIPSALASWEKYEDLVGRYNDDYLASGYQDILGYMGTGQGTHWAIWSSAIPALLMDYPEAEENIGFFAIPGDSADSNGVTVWYPAAAYIYKGTENLDACLAFLDLVVSEEGITTLLEASGAGNVSGPSVIKGYQLPETTAEVISVDVQSYFDAGATKAALEFESSVKGPNCPQITQAVASGQLSAADGAREYDEDCYKQAVQLGLDW